MSDDPKPVHIVRVTISEGLPDPEAVRRARNILSAAVFDKELLAGELSDLLTAAVEDSSLLTGVVVQLTTLGAVLAQTWTTEANAGRPADLRVTVEDSLTRLYERLATWNSPTDDP